MLPLLALNLGDVLQAIIPILILVFWVLAQVFGARAKQGPVGKRPGPPQRRPAAPPKDVANEIEDFLRRVTQQRGNQGPAEVEVLEPAPAPARRRPVAAPTPRAEAVDQALEELPNHQTIANSVRRHLGKHEIEKHTEQLGEAVRETEEELEERLHARFDHQVGRLKHSATPSAYGTPAAPDQGPSPVPDQAMPLVDLLRTSAGIRRAIILNEILNRPVDRW